MNIPLKHVGEGNRCNRTGGRSKGVVSSRKVLGGTWRRGGENETCRQEMSWESNQFVTSHSYGQDKAVTEDGNNNAKTMASIMQQLICIIDA